MVERAHWARDMSAGNVASEVLFIDDLDDLAVGHLAETHLVLTRAAEDH